MRLEASTRGVMGAALAATPAVADGKAGEPEVERWDASSLSVSAHLGLGTPYGAYGAEVERSLAPWAAVAVGVGRSGAHAEELMVAGAGRVRDVHGGHALGLSLGFGYGDSAEWLGPDPSGPAYHSIQNAVWLNGEAYYEYRFASQLMTRVYAGASTALRYDTCTSTDRHVECRPVDSAEFPALGVALGGYF